MPRRAVLAALVLGVLLGAPRDLVSEQLTLAAAYPAPSAAYPQMLSTKSSWLSATGNSTSVGTQLDPTGGAAKLYVGVLNGGSAGNVAVGGYVGVNGITTPAYPLEVSDTGSGGIQVTDAVSNNLILWGNGTISEDGTSIQLPVGSDTVYITARGVGGPGLAQVPDPRQGYEFVGSLFCHGGCP